MTFGIGPYANEQFLRMLGLKGRGFTEIALHPALIYPQMVHLLSKATCPILMDVRITNLNYIPNAEVYPPAIPDLYGAAPIGEFVHSLHSSRSRAINWWLLEESNGTSGLLLLFSGWNFYLFLFSSDCWKVQWPVPSPTLR